MKRKILLIPLALLLAVSLVAIGCPAPAPAPAPAPTPTPEVEAIKWRLQTPFPTGFTTYWAPDNLCKFIEEMSGGRLDIKCFPSGALVPGLTEMHATHEGTLDATWTGSHYHTSEIGFAGDLFNLYPAGLSPRETIAWVYDAGGHELWQEMYDRKNLKIKAFFSGLNGAELFGWYAREMLSLEDFKGLKFRTAGIWGEIVNTLGGSVITCPGGEIYPNMERGVLDAFEYSTPGADYSAGFHELGAYMHGPGIHAPQAAYELLINKDKWNELPDDLKAIVTHATESMVVRHMAMQDYQDTLALDALKEYGTKFVYLPEDVQQAVVETCNEKYDSLATEDAFFAKVLESQRDFVKKYRAFKDFVQPHPDIMTWEK